VISEYAFNILKEGEGVSLDLERGEIVRTGGGIIKAEVYPQFLLEILRDGGLMQNMKKRFGGKGRNA
jgi:3-isopropylmalate dehydratase small subunit